MLAESMERFGRPGQDPIQMMQDAPANATVSDVIPGYMQMVKGAGVRPSPNMASCGLSAMPPPA